MKKFVLAAFAATTVLATPAFAQFGNSSSDTTPITASVTAICTIDAPVGGAVPVSGTQNIGVVGAQCNDPDGFNATVSSANSGVLQGPNGSQIAYQIDIPGTGAPRSLASAQSYPRAPGDQASVDGFTLPVNIITNGVTSGPAFAGNYQDVITFAIAAN